MRPVEITVLRWLGVIAYALATWCFAHDGVTHFEIVFLTVLGIVMFVGTILADWINAGRRPEDVPVCACESFRLPHVYYRENPALCLCGHEDVMHSCRSGACTALLMVTR